MPMGVPFHDLTEIRGPTTSYGDFDLPPMGSEKVCNVRVFSEKCHIFGGSHGF